MSILIPGKLVYLAHPRSGSTATEAALSVYGEPTAKHHARLKDIKDYDGELVCCTMRNPFDMMASWFVLSGRCNMLRFIETWEHSEMVKDGLLYYHQPDSDVLLRYDNLEEGLNNLLLRVGLAPVVIPRLNVTPGKKHFMNYFTEVGCFAAMKKRFGAELEPWL